MKKNSKPELKMSSQQIVDILASQHTKDVFITECKDGPTWSGSHARMDIWTMTRSWSRLLFTGYEIKISRSDFLSDNKWHSYLPLCNQLYFACPKGMILPSEMPKGVGLKYCTQGRATTVVKAEHREVVPPMELFCYILMCRTRIVDPRHYEEPTKAERLQRYKNWLAEKEEARELGHIVSHQLASKINSIKYQNEQFQKRIEFIERAEKVLADMDIRRSSFYGEHTNDDIHEKARRFISVVPPSFKAEASTLKITLERLLAQIEQSEKQVLTESADTAKNNASPLVG